MIRGRTGGLELTGRTRWRRGRSAAYSIRRGGSMHMATRPGKFARFPATDSPPRRRSTYDSTYELTARVRDARCTLIDRDCLQLGDC